MSNQTLDIGPLNGHAVGRILKEAVRRATVAIRNERATFVVHAKAGSSGQMDDVFTTSDKLAQEIYLRTLRTLRECFPLCGIIAEEDNLTHESTGPTAYFTVDPLDGTKAYVRRQSHGIGTMVALVDGDEVQSAYIGDINTQETYGFRPGSSRVHRITHLDTAEELEFRDPYDPAHSYLLLRDPPDKYGDAVAALLPRFKNHLVDGGSIGIWMARLWKREVAAVVVPPCLETPWDSAPVVGISKKLGYLHFLCDDVNRRWVPYEPLPQKHRYRRAQDMLVVHGNDAPLLT